MRPVKTFAAVLIVTTALGGSALARARKTKAETVQCGGGKFSYSFLKPPSYDREPKRRFPILFTSTASTRIHFFDMEKWAARNEVILVSINDTKNGQTMEQWDAVQSAVMESVEANIRVHSCLRFSLGMSGGGMASMRLAKSYNDKFAGVCMLAHSGNGEDRGLAKHIAVAFVPGQTDKTHGVQYARRIHKALKSRDHPVRIHVGDWGHGSGPLEYRERFMDWMLEHQRIAHPNLSPEDRKAAKAEVKRRINALAGIADLAERVAKAEALFDVPDIERWPEAKALRAAWFGAKYEHAQALPGEAAKHEALPDLLLHERTRMCGSTERRKLQQTLKDLRAKSPCKEEWAARRMLEQVAAFEEKAGKIKSKLRQAAMSYGAIAKRYPDTVAGRKAAEAAKRLIDAINAGTR